MSDYREKMNVEERRMQKVDSRIPKELILKKPGPQVLENSWLKLKEIL